MSYHETDHFRVLIANERKDRLALVAPIVADLGHEVGAREIEIEDDERCNSTKDAPTSFLAS
jgi:response regulator NasT